MSYQTIKEGKFEYLDVGEGPVLLLMHGLFGALSNFKEVIDRFSKDYRVVIPILPLFKLSIRRSTIIGLLDYVKDFVETKKLTQLNLLGNSLGGHISLLYTLQNQMNVNSLILTGSSGLYENSLGDSYPRKGSYEYVKEKTEYTFFDPKTATKELVDEVFDIVNSREKAIRILYIARSAIRHNLREQLGKISVPVKLIWGREDRITPLFAAEEFEKLLPNASLNIIEQCGHAAMMEQPSQFNVILNDFLATLYKK